MGRGGNTAANPRAHWPGMVSRILAAVPVNYLLTSIITALLARLLPLEPAEASIAATLLSFVIFAVIAMAVFHARSLARVWLWMSGASLALGAILMLSLITGGRL